MELTILTNFSQTNSSREINNFYANYMTTDGVDMLANLTNLAIFMQITSPEMGLTCWRIWRCWRVLC